MRSPDNAPGQPMDDADFELLDGLRALFELADPMPADLPERVRFALALRGLENELARLVSEEGPQLAGARGAERSRTVTFDSSSLTIMLRIERNESDAVRIDGWLAPAQPRRIELETSAETLHVSSDADGRFAFADVPPGTARLIVIAADRDRAAGGHSVVTPALVL